MHLSKKRQEGKWGMGKGGKRGKVRNTAGGVALGGGIR